MTLSNNVVTVIGLVFVAIGLVSVFMTGFTPASQRVIWGRFGAACIIIGSLILLYAAIIPPEPPSFNGYAV